MTASVYSHICNFHLPYLREFQRRGWETHVGCQGIPEHAPYTNKAISLPFEKKMLSRANLRAKRKLRNLIIAEEYDLIIAHTSLAAFFTRLALKGMKHRPATVNVVHGYLFDNGTPILRRWALLCAERLVAPQTDLVLAMNDWDLNAAERYHLGSRISKIPGMGVDFSRLASASGAEGVRPHRALGIPNDAFVLLYPAEFSQRKSQRVLIEAMPLLPNSVRLVLCGEGDGLPKCKELAKRLGVADRVLFPGQVGDIATWYRMADVLVASSRSEGLPFNVMEAMYLGVPAVVSAVKGHTDLVLNGETGLTYPYGNAEQLAQCVAKLIADKDLRKRLGTNARKSVEEYALTTVLPRVMVEYLSATRPD